MFCYSTASNQKLRKFFERIKMDFGRNQSTTKLILTIRGIIGVHSKNLEAIRLFSNQLLYQFYHMDAPQGRWLSVLRKSLMRTAQECYELYGTNSGSNIPQDSSSTATYLPSWKPSKLVEQDMRDTAGKVRTNS